MAAVPAYPERVREPRFKQDRPKRVDYSLLWEKRPNLIARGSPEEKDLLAIIHAIDRGNLIPTHCYRNGIERNYPEDRLLDEQGIKHLHLGGASGNVILYLVEYETFVLLLEIGTHKDLETEPPGSVLASLHHACLRRADAESVSEKLYRAAGKAAIALKGLLPKRDRD